MSDPRQIEQELREFLAKEDNMCQRDKLPALMLIINKHFGLDSLDHMVNNYDFERIISDAKSAFATTTMPVFLSKRDKHSSDVNYLLVMEAFVSYLNKHSILKRLVKFDRRR